MSVIPSEISSNDITNNIVFNLAIKIIHESWSTSKWVVGLLFYGKGCIFGYEAYLLCKLLGFNINVVAKIT